MSRTNLHIFNDPVGFFSNKIAAYISSLQPGGNRYLNTAAGCKNKLESIDYCSIDTFLKHNPQLKTGSVIFHSYNYFNKNFIKKIRAAYPGQDIKFIWIFWSHEYYQLPEFFSSLYQGFSRRLYLRKLVSFHVEQARLYLKGGSASPFYSGLGAFKKTFKEFDLFGAFLEGDHNIVMKGLNGIPYSFVSYLSVKDFPDIPNDLAVEKKGVMVGHAGSPILNHYEVVEMLAKINASNKILIPLSYGKGVYIKTLKKELQKFRQLNIECLEEYMSKDAYYKKIEDTGFFILNSFCQQALGNIVFFLWAGTKIFVRKNTSTYQTLKQQSFHIYTIEDDLASTGLAPLTLEQKQHNHRLISELISEANVESNWRKILEFNQ